MDKLIEKHIKVNNFDKMKYKFALQIFSKKVFYTSILP